MSAPVPAAPDADLEDRAWHVAQLAERLHSS